ncbi:hypothetical protein ETB97_006780 [Aspergillus alliaceus]|uniref:NmrA-like domain-containing protein n=1 Tax=Petromyces alliaceus TaxID=209559 RepID=A0A8H6E298_PETAA|nr:hypothetical protein ETB97_006780 [Aspergillus burnettii]
MVWIHKNLISAAIKAGVRRFAPSEWGSAGSRGMAFYGYEDKVRKYLAEVVQEKNKLEYCLFQPSYFTNYFGYFHSTTNRVFMTPTYIDFGSRRAICRQRKL